MLLYQMLPEKVANDLKNGRQVEAGNNNSGLSSECLPTNYFSDPSFLTYVFGAKKPFH